MGDRVSIQFVNGNDRSVVLFSHWGGMSFVRLARAYVTNLKTNVLPGRVGGGQGSWPIDRLEPNTVMVDFIRHVTRGVSLVDGNYYLGATETDGDNSDNGHFEIDLYDDGGFMGEQ